MNRVHGLVVLRFHCAGEFPEQRIEMSIAYIGDLVVVSLTRSAAAITQDRKVAHAVDEMKHCKVRFAAWQGWSSKSPSLVARLTPHTEQLAIRARDLRNFGARVTRSRADASGGVCASR